MPDASSSACEVTEGATGLACSDACVVVEFRRLDLASECVAEPIVGVCHAAEATVVGNGAVGCFERVGGTRARAPSTAILVEGDDLIAEQGWFPCEDDAPTLWPACP